MTTGATPIRVPRAAQSAFQQFFTSAWNMSNTNWNIRENLRQKDLIYMREQDYSQEQWRAKLANMMGDPSKVQNITVPVVMPQVETAAAHLESVFLSGNPIFGVTTTPKYADAGIQMESIIEENQIRGAWTAEISRFFRDTLKYNIGILEVAWENQVVAQLETNTSFSLTQGEPKQVIWSGNVIRRWDPYNTFFDTRVDPRDLARKGEFVGRTELMSRIALKDFINKLPDKIVSNIKDAFESGVGGANTSYDKYYVPFLNPYALLPTSDPRATTNWMAWAGLETKDPSKIRYQNMYQVNTIYCRILPSEFGLQVPAANTPQVWKLIFVNGQVLIYAERQTNAHNLLPVFINQALDDGLSYQTKSFADNVTPYQQVASALMTANLSARRRAISDRVLYDPSRIDAKEINNPAANAKIPVRSAAYGKPLNEAVFPFPFRDDQAGTNMQELQQLLQFANSASGQNQAAQGQFVKGNKTLHEYADVMGNSNARNVSMALNMEANTWGPVKEVLKLNILQYQKATTVYSPSREEEVTIDPVLLRKANVCFKLSDGLLPSDKILNADTLASFMQYGFSNPAVMAEYNMTDVVTYLFKQQGADLKPFEKPKTQVAYEQAMNQWSQLAQLAIQNKQPFNTPQPKPADYGYDPNARPGLTSDETAEQNGTTILQQVAGTMELGSQNPNTPAQQAAVKNSQQPLDQTTPPAPSAGV